MLADAAKTGRALYDLERDILRGVFRLEHTAMEGLLALQGLGDLGETAATEDVRTLQRSDEPAERRRQESATIHPHRKLISFYIPLNLVC